MQRWHRQANTTRENTELAAKVKARPMAGHFRALADAVVDRRPYAHLLEGARTALEKCISAAKACGHAIEEQEYWVAEINLQ